MKARIGIAALVLTLGFEFLPLFSAGASTGPQPSVGDVSVFARVPSPGYPGYSVTDRAGDVYVSTSRGPDLGAARPADPTRSTEPSRIFRYDRNGELIREYVVAGQDVQGDHGLQGMAFDTDGRLYVVDYAPPRVLRFDVDSGAQRTYATIPDLPACSPLGTGPCDNGILDAKPWPVGLAFDGAGNLYVTDLAQATVFRVGNGGGAARVWAQSPLWTSTYALSGVQLDRRGNAVVSLVGSAGLTPDEVGSTTSGGLYRIPIRSDGSAGEPRRLWQGRPGEAPDGFALARSGRVYVCTLVGNQVVVVEPDGTEAARHDSGDSDVPFDSPSSATFADGHVLVTNLTFVTGDSRHHAVLDLFAGEPGMPLYYPKVSS